MKITATVPTQYEVEVEVGMYDINDFLAKLSSEQFYNVMEWALVGRCDKELNAKLFKYLEGELEK